MKSSRKIYIALMLAFCLCVSALMSVPTINVKAASTTTNEMIYGADIGFLSQLENQGVTWVDDNGNEKDALELLSY